VLALRRTALIAAIAAILAMIPAASGRADLASNYAAGQQKASSLQSAIHADTAKIQDYEGTINSLEQRLRAVQQALDIQQRMLRAVNGQLSVARSRLARLRREYARDQRVLAAQVVAQYEAPTPTVVDVVVNSTSFGAMLTRLSYLKRIEQANAAAVKRTRILRLEVAAQTRRLTATQARDRRSTAAVLGERENIAQLRLSIVNRELATSHDRSAKNRQLSAVSRALSKESAELSQQAAAADAASAGTGAPPPGGCINTPFVPHGGEYGFFQEPGTNYSVNEEPVIAARLDALGKALDLHLEGISGYRTPEHSVAVGGYADDPHTKGEASDTPGVEGVPESTLEQFCLTRPFPGASEADHIQELGSPT
jgi:peptidoglycan hydrolase CwlO-like protein